MLIFIPLLPASCVKAQYHALVMSYFIHYHLTLSTRYETLLQVIKLYIPNNYSIINCLSNARINLINIKLSCITNYNKIQARAASARRYYNYLSNYYRPRKSCHIRCILWLIVVVIKLTNPNVEIHLGFRICSGNYVPKRRSFSQNQSITSFKCPFRSSAIKHITSNLPYECTTETYWAFITVVKYRIFNQGMGINCI